MRIYGLLQKIEEQDDGTVRIEGIASSESVDSAGEVILASAMKAALPDFMKFGGTGALREMHGLSAAGTVDYAHVDDDGFTHVTATIVDEVACRKALKGVYKGLSVGGKVVSRDNHDRKKITAIQLVECSLVDRPCNPDATFRIAKADGLEMDDVSTTDPLMEDLIPDPNAAEEVSKRDFDAKQRRADARSGAAMKDGSFPIVDREDLKNAIRLAGNAKNPSAARAHIKRRAAALGAEDMIPDTWKDGKKAADAADGTDVLEKAIEPAPLNPSKIGDVMGNTTVGETADGVGDAVAGKHVAVKLPGNENGKATEVKNPEEAGQASPDPLGETDVAPVENIRGEKPKPGKDTRSVKDAADHAGAVTEEVVEDPLSLARTAADNALKAATAVLQRLSKHDNGISPVLAPGFELRKGLHATGRLGYLLCELAYCLTDAQLEKDREGDNSTVPEKLHAAVGSLAAAYKAMSDEELQELLDAADQTMSVQIALAAAAGDLRKALDGVVDADALAKVAGDSGQDALVKTLTEERSELIKIVGGLTSAMDGVTAKMATMAEELEAVKDTPMPPKTVTKAADPAILTAIGKEQDGQPRVDQLSKGESDTLSEDAIRAALDSMSEEERNMAIMKASLSRINARVIQR